MSQYIDKSVASQIIELSTELSVILFDRLGQDGVFGSVECARNIFLIDREGNVVWQVTSDFDSNGGPFTNIICVGGRLQGYRWDGGMYEVDLATGRAEPSLLLK
ncbi:hypothetical protein [Pseudomonas fluorescens]|jgi:hypothetical protein|uniref:hypothetical protein n=1 Tax=Pseudomonas fluorescens TaxID=294 RepID=UPI001C83B47E|nr:hypothetical protein [Pseudomonas fluorescens]